MENNEWTLIEAMFAPSGERGTIGLAPKKVSWSDDRGATWKTKKYGSPETARYEANKLSKEGPVNRLVRLGKEYL